jgi:hypothetical protein
MMPTSPKCSHSRAATAYYVTTKTAARLSSIITKAFFTRRTALEPGSITAPRAGTKSGKAERRLGAGGANDLAVVGSSSLLAPV